METTCSAEELRCKSLLTFAKKFFVRTIWYIKPPWETCGNMYLSNVYGQTKGYTSLVLKCSLKLLQLPHGHIGGRGEEEGLW